MNARWRYSVIWLLMAVCAPAVAQPPEPGAFLLQLPPPVESGIGPLRQLRLDPLGLPRVVNGEDRRSRGFLSLDAGPGLSLLCDGAFGISAALADLERHCLLGRLDEDRWTLGRVDQLSVSSSLSLDGAGLPIDLDFGLSWLRSDSLSDEQDLQFDLLDPRFAPQAGLAGDLAGESVHLSATHWLNQRSWLRVTGRGSRLRQDQLIPNGSTMRINSRSLRFDAGVGDFAGSLTGRQSRIPQLDRRWFDIDVGVSWRTPWSAQLTVGARNLLSPADAMATPESSKSGERVLDARTPYVRYQQDL